VRECGTGSESEEWEEELKDGMVLRVVWLG